MTEQPMFQLTLTLDEAMLLETLSGYAIGGLFGWPNHAVRWEIEGGARELLAGDEPRHSLALKMQRLGEELLATVGD